MTSRLLRHLTGWTGSSSGLDDQFLRLIDSFRFCTNFSLTFFSFRFCINFGVTFGYYGFWHSTLDVFGWASRPFNPRRHIGRAKVWTNKHMKWLFDEIFAKQVFHNMFYSLLGVVQYTIWEGIILHCYATGRLPYLTNKEVVSLSNLWIGTLSSLFFSGGLGPLELLLLCSLLLCCSTFQRGSLLLFSQVGSNLSPNRIARYCHNWHPYPKPVNVYFNLMTTPWDI